jgi:hypothetical protein
MVGTTPCRAAVRAAERGQATGWELADAEPGLAEITTRRVRRALDRATGRDARAEAAFNAQIEAWSARLPRRAAGQAERPATRDRGLEAGG